MKCIYVRNQFSRNFEVFIVTIFYNCWLLVKCFLMKKNYLTTKKKIYRLSCHGCSQEIMARMDMQFMLLPGDIRYIKCLIKNIDQQIAIYPYYQYLL